MKYFEMTDHNGLMAFSRIVPDDLPRIQALA